MFGTLIESRATPQRRAGSSIASVIFHGAIITAALIATTKGAARIQAPPLEVTVVHFVPPSAPRPATSSPATVASASVASIPFLPRLSVPQVVPVGIPAVDLSAVPTTTDFNGGPIGPRIQCAPDDCPGHALVDGDHALWSTRDIMMQLKDAPVPPRYPESLRRAGIEDDVVVRFTVDTTGRIDMAAVEVLSSTHEAFTASVRETLARLRFTPSMVGERKVKALAIMPFRFTLR